VRRKKKHLGIVKNTLRDADPGNRMLAAESLGRMGPAAEEAVPDLIQVLGEENDSLRSTSVTALAAIGAGAVPSLVAALNHQGPIVRSGAADALGVSGPGRRRRFPRSSTCSGTRTISHHAASALGRIGAAAVPALMQVAAKEDSRVAGMAETAFSYLNAGPNLVHELARLLGNNEEKPGVRAFAAKALGRMQEKAKDAAPDLARALGDDNSEVRSAARWALSRIGPAAVPALREALKNGNSQVRSSAAFALGSMGPAAEDAVPALAQTLQDENPVVRIEAISALEKIQASSEAVVKALIRVLDRDKDDFVRLNAARVLNKIWTAEAKEAVSNYNKQKPASQ
jgi:HEAT repeat protein